MAEDVRLRSTQRICLDCSQAGETFRLSQCAGLKWKYACVVTKNIAGSSFALTLWRKHPAGRKSGADWAPQFDDRKQGEAALRESERNSRLFVDGIPGLVAGFTPGGEVEFVNRQVLRLLLVGRPRS